MDDSRAQQVGRHRGDQRRALIVALVLNGGYLFVEAGAGLAFNSLALLADAVHMSADVAALALALLASYLATRPATARHTFGLGRAEVLSAAVNGMLLLASVAWISWEAIGRLREPEPVAGAGLLLVAMIGLAINVGSALSLIRVAGGNLNIRGSIVHLTLDAAGSGAAMLAGIAIVWRSATWVDSAASLVVAALVLWAAVRLIRDATHVLLEGSPREVDVAAVVRALHAAPGVRAVHHVHLWNLASDDRALSAHLVLGDSSLHDAETILRAAKSTVCERFHLGHVFLEAECHECGEPDEVAVMTRRT